jgi:hypothetical protein
MISPPHAWMEGCGLRWIQLPRAPCRDTHCCSMAPDVGVVHAMVVTHSVVRVENQFTSVAVAVVPHRFLSRILFTFEY